MPVTNGTTGNDTIVGSSSGETLNGLAGNDVITGGGSSNSLSGGDGNDTLTGGGSYNYLYGGNDSDVLTGGGSYNYLYGDGGDDILTAGGANNYLDGGSGDDTLETGDEDDVTLIGSSGDDRFVIQWESATENSNFTTLIDESYDGDDTLDLSDVASSLDNLRFGGSYYDLYVYVLDGDGDQIGTITLDDHFYYSNSKIETIVVGDEVFDISNVSSASELNSIIVHGATSGADSITGGEGRDTINGLGGDDTITTSEGAYSRAYGGDGNDVVTASSDYQYLFGGDGDDVLHTGDNDNIYMYGCDDDDTYVIEWESASTSDNYYTYVYDNSGGDDTLDLSDVAANLDFISFGGSYGDLYIYINDEDGDQIGYILLDNQYYSSNDYPYQIETLVLGDETIDLSAYSSTAALISSVKYGATTGDDSIVGGTGTDTINGLDGDDTIKASEGNYARVYGDDGDDVLTASGYSQYIYGCDDHDSLATGGHNSTNLYGGSGNDTLSTGNGDYAYLYGGADDDTYVVNWENASTSDTYYTYIYDSGAGNDTLDISSLAANIDDISFGNYYGDLRIYIHDDDGNQIGTIHLENQFYSTSSKIETIVLGNETVDLGAYDSFTELNSVVRYGASNGDDLIVGGASRDTIDGLEGDDTITASEASSSRVYGAEGNDDITAGGDYQYLYGQAGDDTLSTGDNDYTYMFGGEGNDTYSIDWESASCDDHHYAQISGTYTDGGNNDILDLSALADDISEISFSGDGSTLVVYIYGDDRWSQGYVTISYQFYDYYGDQIEKIVLGDEEIDLTGYNSAGDLTSQLIYGTGNGDDSVVGESGLETIYGYEGDDTITGYGSYTQLYGNDGDDVLTAGGSTEYLYGGAGEDTLDSGDYTGGNLYGNSGADTYLITWESNDSSNNFYTTITDYSYSSSTDGADVLDLSAVADSVDNLSFSGSYYDLYIYVNDDDGNRIGTIVVDYQYYSYYSDYYQVETLIVGDDTIDLSAATSGQQLNSIVKYGASGDDDIISSDTDSEYVYGLGGDDIIDVQGDYAVAGGDAGNDTITIGGYDSSAYGSAGDDLIISTGYSGYMSGAEGDDTLRIEGSGTAAYGADDDDVYQIAWTDASANNYHYAYLYDYDYASSPGDDVLDLTDLVDDLSYISFGYYSYYDLAIYIQDENGNTIGRIVIDDQYYWSSYYDRDIETLQIGDMTFDLTYGSSYSDLNSALSALVSNSNDVLTGTNAGDVLAGYGGNDTISGGGGADYLSGGKGEDVLKGENGDDTLVGGTGADSLNGGDKNDVIEGGSGNDTLIGGDGSDYLDGGEHHDVITAGTGNDEIYGGHGSDTIDAGSGNDRIFSGTHDDLIDAGDGYDLINGNHGADTIDGGDGIDTIQYYYSGTGVIVNLATGEASGGQAEGDVLSNIENIRGSRTDDHLTGDDNDNKFLGFGGNDTMNGGNGDDHLEGIRGHDVLNGDGGNDYLFGGVHRDTLDGGEGDDTLVGGSWADTFVFGTNSGDDIITDFEVARDFLDLNGTETDFTDLDSVIDASTETDAGLLIDLGDGNSVLLENITLSDLSDMYITY